MNNYHVGDHKKEVRKRISMLKEDIYDLNKLKFETDQKLKEYKELIYVLLSQL